MLLIGPHRFEGVLFYAAPQAELPATARRGSLSLLQMYLAADVGRREAAGGADQAESAELPQSSASSSIKEMLSRNPGLVQLLNNTCTKKASPAQAPPKPRPVFFKFAEGDGLFVFPQSACAEPLSPGPSADLLVSFVPPLAGSSHPLTMVVRAAAHRLVHAIQVWTRDPLRLHADFIPSIGGGLFAVPYRETAYPFHPPCDLASEVDPGQRHACLSA